MSGPGNNVKVIEVKIKRRSVFKSNYCFNIFAFEYTIFDDDRKN